MKSMRSSHRLLILAVLLSLGPMPASAQLCFNDSVYLDLEDEPISFPICHNGVLTCQEPELSAPQYTLDSLFCDQTWQPCGVTATVDTKFPGNHQNDPSEVGFGYSFGTLLLETFGGTLIDACGVAGAAISRDIGQFIHSEGVTCALAKKNPDAFKLRLTAIMCPCAPNLPICPWASCEKQAEVILDYVLPALECPPKNECCDRCGECVAVGSGGAAANGTAAGMCLLDSGPGARLRYVAGGAGSTNLPGTPAWTPILGRGWSHDYAERLVRDPDDSRVWLITRFGSFREFRDGDGDGGYKYVSPSDEQRQLRRTAGGWELEDLYGTVQSFDSSGRWQSTLDPNGVGKTATYGVSGLARVDMPDGRQKRFTYHPGGKLAEIVEVGVDGVSARTWSYTWAGDDLVEIQRPDGTRLRFRYEDPRHPGYVTQSILVGTDGSERVETAWQYDHAGRVVRIWQGDIAPGTNGPVPGPGAVEVSMSFTGKDNLGLVTESVVTDPLGQASTYEFGRDSVSAKPRVIKITGDCPACGLGPNSQLFYDDPANPMRPTRMVDARGTVTQMTYDARGRMTSRTEALGTGLQRTTTWEYDATHPGLVTAIEQPSTSGSGSRHAEMVYDAGGNLISRTIEGIEAGNAFSLTTSIAYNTQGQETIIDPPGFGTQDQIISTYDPARGSRLLQSRTTPIGTTAFEYGPLNRRVRTTDPNGVATELTYDPLDRLTSITKKGATVAQDLETTYVYSEFDDLVRTVLPEGNVLEYGYDAAGRLVSIERKPDAATPGERTLYTLNAAGNRIREESTNGGAGPALLPSRSLTSSTRPAVNSTRRCTPTVP